MAMTQPGMFLSQPPMAEHAVVVHAAGDHFDAVGDDLARHQAVAHALVAHHDAVRGGRRAEDLRHAAGGADAFDGGVGEPLRWELHGVIS